MSTHEIAYVDSFPKCDFCSKTAEYDAKIRKSAQWAYMCDSHMTQLGDGLGLGRGQKLAIRSKQNERTK